MKEETVARIEQYLNGELSENDRISFEKEMQIDSELQKQVEFMRLLPKAVRAHTEMSLKNKLKEIEANLPKVKFEPELNIERSGGSRQEISQEPRSISNFRWMNYAIAASVLFGIIVFNFRDEIFRVRNSSNQMAQTKVDSIAKGGKSNSDSSSIQGSEPITWQFAITDADVIIISEQKIGYAERLSKKRIAVIQEYFDAIKSLNQRDGEFYRLYLDTLFITGVLYGRTEHIIVDSVEIVEANFNKQKEHFIDSLDRVIDYEKPALRGLFVLIEGSFYRIENNKNYTPLVKVKAVEAEQLRFYTQ